MASWRVNGSSSRPKTTALSCWKAIEGSAPARSLLKPELAPSEYRDSFPAVPQALKNTISDLDTDIAPSRDAAEPIITRRHTEPGIEPWTPIANQRRLLRLLASGKTLKEICEATGMTPARAQRLLQDARLIEHVLSLGCWSKDEQRHLRSPDLKPNAFIRFFSLKGVKDTLKMLFESASGRPTSGLSAKDFNRSVELLARQFLIPSDESAKPEADTRSVPQDVFAKLASRDKALAKHLNLSSVASNSGSGKKTKLSAKVDKFFESLECPLHNQQLRQLTKEDLKNQLWWSSYSSKLPITSNRRTVAHARHHQNWPSEQTEQRVSSSVSFPRAQRSDLGFSNCFLPEEPKQHIFLEEPFARTGHVASY